jgi:sorting nexin-29
MSTLRQILELRHEYRRPTYALFIDFRAAFDSVDRAALWRLLKADGCPSKLVDVIRALYDTTSGKVRGYGDFSEEFELTTGVRQGCLLSPLLFLLVIDAILADALEGHAGGVEVLPGNPVKDLAYADDVAILADDPSILQEMLDRIADSASAVGLVISAPKSKCFGCCTGDTLWNIYLHGEELEKVDCFCYLGSTITPTGNVADEVTARVNKATSVFERLRKRLWSSKEVSISTKSQVYHSAVRSVLLYGCESWALREEDLRRLETFESRKLRQLLGVSYRDKITNTTILTRAKIKMTIRQTVYDRRMKWLGHILRMNDARLPKRALLATPETGWRRPAGGAQLTWNRLCARDLLPQRGGVHPRTWYKDWVKHMAPMAQDRKQWIAAYRDACCD